MLSSATLHKLVHFGIELVQAGLAELNIVFTTALLLPYGTTTQFSIYSTISPTLNSFLQARHFADLPCFFPKITFCGFLNAGCSRNIVARFPSVFQKENINFPGSLSGHCWTLILSHLFQSTYFWELTHPLQQGSLEEQT